MLTPLQEEAVRLYKDGRDLREVADEVGRSHEWVRKTLKAAGVPVRLRGAPPHLRCACEHCGQPCPTARAKFCSRECFSAHVREPALQRVMDAKALLEAGETYTSAAQKSGFRSGWELFGRLYHFGLVKKSDAVEASKGSGGRD